MSKLPDNLKMQTTNPQTPGGTLKTMQANNELQNQANKSIGGTRRKKRRQRRRQRGGDMQATPLPNSGSNNTGTNSDINNVYQKALVTNTQGNENAKYDKVEVKTGGSKRTRRSKRRRSKRTRRTRKNK